MDQAVQKPPASVQDKVFKTAGNDKNGFLMYDIKLIGPNKVIIGPDPFSAQTARLLPVAFAFPLLI